VLFPLEVYENKTIIICKQTLYAQINICNRIFLVEKTNHNGLFVTALTVVHVLCMYAPRMLTYQCCKTFPSQPLKELFETVDLYNVLDLMKYRYIGIYDSTYAQYYLSS